jgi:hypothetical protein
MTGERECMGSKRGKGGGRGRGREGEGRGKEGGSKRGGGGGEKCTHCRAQSAKLWSRLLD